MAQAGRPCACSHARCKSTSGVRTMKKYAAPRQDGGRALLWEKTLCPTASSEVMAKHVGKHRRFAAHHFHPNQLVFQRGDWYLCDTAVPAKTQMAVPPAKTFAVWNTHEWVLEGSGKDLSSSESQKMGSTLSSEHTTPSGESRILGDSSGVLPGAIAGSLTPPLINPSSRKRLLPRILRVRQRPWTGRSSGYPRAVRSSLSPT